MSIELAKNLADYIIKSKKAEMRWTWGQGIMGAALDDLDKYLGTDNYTDFLCRFCDYYVKHTPKVASSDTAAPGFITYAMQVRTGKAEYKKLTDKVLDYITKEPRVYKDAVNHLGGSVIGKFYPVSIWVDSLMMFSVFPARYASENNDAALLDIAARQPALYADCMMSDSGLWYHSFWIKKRKHFPKGNIFWGRGNGWVISALPKILDCIGEHPEKQRIITVLQKTVEAVSKKQNADGSFNTLLGRKTYKESSATALIADGIFHAVRMGYVDKKYLETGVKAYGYAAGCVKQKGGKVRMTKISGPTIPLPVIPYLGYACIGKSSNFPYGVAAFVWAAIEYDKLVKAGVIDENSKA